MKTGKSIQIDLKGNEIRSLSWMGNDLVDIAGGYKKISLENGEITYGANFGFRFDGVALSADGSHAAIFETFGTKALLLKHGQIVREISRSYYHADVYEYPISFLQRASEPLKIAHCPNGYNVLQIEDFETGEIVEWKDSDPTDFFHSRLQMSPDNRWLLSAGWIWHPIDAIELFDISTGSPKPFSPFWNDSSVDIGLWEVSNATFQPDSSLLMSGTRDQDKEDASEEISLVVFDLASLEIRSQTTLDAPTGALFPIDGKHVLAFYEFPRLLDIESGSIILSWPEILTDKTNSSISFLDHSVKIAVDTVNRRFAVANEESLTIATFS